jgi:hypothetical protein
MNIYSFLITLVLAVICCLLLGLIAPYIQDAGMITEQDKMNYCSKLSGDGDAISMAWNHECVYNCTMYWPNKCLDHGWHYEKGATTIQARITYV